MIEIVISDVALRLLTETLSDDVERGAAIYLNHDPISNRYLVHEVAIAGEADCLHSNRTEITFAPEFLAAMTRRARASNRSCALLHTHPSGFDEFSRTDDQTEAGLVDFMQRRNPGRESFSFVLCDGRLIARRFGAVESAPVRVVGADVVIRNTSTSDDQQMERYDRQIRAFGKSGQKLLRGLGVAIVGLGGTGSVVAQQLAYLGIGRFVLIDPDSIDETNLNRVVGATPLLLERDKVDSAADLIAQISPFSMIHRFKGSAMTSEAVKLLRGVDCLFICTDSHVSRAFLSEFAYQYLIPGFDIGVSINAHDGAVTAVTGRAQMVAPGLPCLSCSNAISSQRVREELMTPEQKAADPYFNDGGEKQPAVISINSAIASMAVSMFLGAFTAIPIKARWQSYDALSGSVRLLSSKTNPNCAVCGPSGVTGAGDTRQLTFAETECGSCS